MSSTMLVLAALVCVALAAPESSPDAIVPEFGAPASPSTVRFLLRDTTSKATDKLHSSELGYDVKSARKDGLVETFGTHLHKPAFADMGFELLEAQDGQGFESSPDSKGYHTPAQLHEAFVALAQKHPQQAKLIDLTKEYKQSKTHEGRSIYAIKISENAAEDLAKPNTLVVSNHHARELITPELALHAASELLEKQQTDPELKQIVQRFQTYIIWTMNPDGLNTVWTTDNWKRTNARNVDLNRNYPIGYDLSCGGSDNKLGENWKGPHPFSEPETQTMQAFQKDRNFAKVMDFHSYSEEVRTNYADCASLPDSINEGFKAIRDVVAKKMNYEASRSCCMGGDIHYAYNRHGSLAYLVEIGQAFQPSPDEMQGVVKQVWPGLKYFLTLEPSVSGIITDAKGTPMIDAQIKLPGLSFSLNERFQSGKHGHYHIWLPEGKHNVEVQAAALQADHTETPVTKVVVEADSKGTVKHISL